MLARSTARRRAATLVECAIVYPVTFLLMLGLIVGGMGVFRYQEVAHLAREAARYASVHGGRYAEDNAAAIQQGTLPDVTEAYLTQNVVKAGASTLDPDQVTVQVSLTTVNGSFDWDDTASSKNRWPDSTTTQNQQQVTKTNTVTVTVTYTWVPELYLVGPITLSSTSVMPMSY